MLDGGSRKMMVATELVSGATINPHAYLLILAAAVQGARL
jgi:hypothetical protein